VKFSIFKPDFVEFFTEGNGDGTIKATYFIIDAKASAHMKVSHQVQVAFYWLALQETFKSDDKITFVPLEDGAIWLHHQDEPSKFSLTLVQPLIEDFLFVKLPQLLDVTEGEGKSDKA